MRGRTWLGGRLQILFCWEEAITVGSMPWGGVNLAFELARNKHVAALVEGSVVAHCVSTRKGKYKEACEVHEKL